MVTMTESAASKIKELGAQEPEGEANVFRIAVTGGGCSGFRYEFGFDRGPKDGDNEIEMHGVMSRSIPSARRTWSTLRSTSSTP